MQRLKKLRYRKIDGRIFILLAVLLSIIILPGCNLSTKDAAARTVQRTQDGGYILAGDTVEKSTARPTEAWMMKTDAQGNEEWFRTFRANEKDYARIVQQTRDGGYILAGYGQSSQKPSESWLVKTDAKGSEEWYQTFSVGERNYIYSVQQTQDEGYILVGSKRSYERDVSDAWMIKTDAKGKEEWSHVFGGSEEDRVNSVEQTRDGGYIMAGIANSEGVFSGDGWLIKTDAQGDEEWSRTFGGSERDYINSVKQTQDGGYILAGNTRSYGSDQFDVWLIKTNSQGEEEWSQVFEESEHALVYSMDKTREGGYILAGQIGPLYAADAWLMKMDAQGEEEWSQTFGGGEVEVVYAIQQTKDGGYILAGATESYASGGSVAWLIKTDFRGDEDWSQTFGGKGSQTGVAIFLLTSLVLLIYNTIYFSFYSRDMRIRKENKLAWLFKYMLLGPLAVAWYKSYRKAKEGEAESRGGKLYKLAKNIIIPWSIYALTLPGIYLSIVTMIDILQGSITLGQSTEMIFWVPLMYVMFVIPIWFVSLIIPVVIMLVKKP